MLCDLHRTGLHNTEETFLRPSLITLYSWCPGPLVGLGDITDKYSDSSNLPILENIQNCHVKVIKSKDILNMSELDVIAHLVYIQDSPLVFLEFLSNGN